jgi:hypothetical protein
MALNDLLRQPRNLCAKRLRRDDLDLSAISHDLPRTMLDGFERQTDELPTSGGRRSGRACRHRNEPAARVNEPTKRLLRDEHLSLQRPQGGLESL